MAKRTLVFMILILTLLLSQSAQAADVPQPALNGKDVVIEMPKYTAVFSSRGGTLKSFRLKDYRSACATCADDLWERLKNLFDGQRTESARNGGPIELVNVREDSPFPLSVTFHGADGTTRDDGLYGFSLSAPDQQGQQRLVFSRNNGDSRIDKIFSFSPSGYKITLEVKVFNLSSEPVTQNPVLNWYQHVDAVKKDKDFGHDGPVAGLGTGAVERMESKDIKGDTLLGPNIRWTAYESKYFIASFIPENPSLASVTLTRDSDNTVGIALKGQKTVIPGGQSETFSYSMYLGPKKYSLLQTMGVGLESAVNFGWFRFLSVPLLMLLNFFYGFVGNYGIAIVLMTILIKAVFLPMGAMSSQSMKAMRDLKPQLDVLKEKYKGDRGKIGEETMKLYREKKVNPFSGVLPILIQVPVFIGLYRALMYAVELRQAPFFGWLQDLSARDPYYIVPVLMGISQFVVQKITPSAANEETRKVLLWLPVLFTFLFAILPSGLVVYWLINNILQICQQLYLNKKLGLNEAVAPKKKTAGQLAAETE